MTEAPALSIIQALDHPALFAPHFKGETWGPWRAFLAALFALPMDDAALEMYRRHTGRTEPPAESAKEACLVVGRRGGKSRVLALVAVYLAVFRSYDEHLAPGERATIAVIAADRKQARTILRYITGLLKAVPVLAEKIIEETAEGITLDNRVVIEIATASFRVTRGYSFAAVLADETAFWRDDSSANPDVEIFRALRPGMTSIPGAILLNASSPYRRAGVLWTTFQRNYGKEDARILVWKASTLEMNAQADEELIADAYEEDPEAAASEFGAEFRSDLADFVSRAIVDACVEQGCHERPPARSAGRRYVAFIDAAGGSGSDSMTMGVAHLEDGMPVLDALRERRPPFSPDDVVTEFAALLKSYGVTKAEADKWGGDWVGEAFRKQGIIVTPGAKPKADLYRELLPLLNAHRCSLLDHPRLVAQLCALERRTSRSGKDSIDHASGPTAHDDVANAAAGVLVRCGTARPPMRISQEMIDAISRPAPGHSGWYGRMKQGGFG